MRKCWLLYDHLLFAPPSLFRLLEEATCNDAWGPDSRTMARIAEASRHYDEFGPIMAFIWKR